MTNKWIPPLLLLALIEFGLSACSVFPSKHFPLSSNANEVNALVAQQQWQLSYGKDRYSLQIIIERTPTYWQWIMLNNLGQRLATATITGTTLTIDKQQSHPANALIPELLEAVEFSYWPLGDLQNSSDGSWSFQESAMHRDVYFSGILRASINYESKNAWQGRLSYDNKKSGFHLDVESQLLD